ncbi:MAG: hypothetical protein RL150_423 [Candidatus Parcubacteria bacterium]|jgi:hypothetical protein
MKPLSARRRNVSMLGLLLIFLIGAPFLIAYSTGYRFSWEKFSFVETGGVFIYADLPGTRVFINDEFFESNGTILRNTLIQNLESEQVYTVRVEKDGYLPWYKDLYVYPNLVTEGRILMLPIEIPFEEIAMTLPVPEQATSTKRKATPLPNPAYTTALELFTATTTLDTAPLIPVAFPFNDALEVATTAPAFAVPDYIAALGIPNIAEKEQLQEQWRMVAWLEEGNIHAAWAGAAGSAPFFLCDVRGCRDRAFVSLDTEIERFSFYPGRNDAFIVETQNHIFAVEADDRSRQNLQTIYEGAEPTFRLVGNTIYVLDGEALYRAEL